MYVEILETREIIFTSNNESDLHVMSQIKIYYELHNNYNLNAMYQMLK